MNCAKCHTSNFADDRFCRHCGISLAAPAVAGSQTDQALKDAFDLLDRGLGDDAAAMAQQALALDPGCAAARSALGLIYERMGRTDEAIRQLEEALALDPDSEADRERLELLRARSAGRRRLSPAQMGVAAAVCTGVLVFAAGVLLVLNNPTADLRPQQRQAALRTASGPVDAGNAPGPVQESPLALKPLVPSPLSAAPSPTGSTVGPALTQPAAKYPAERSRPMNGAASASAELRIGLPPVQHQPTPQQLGGLPPAAVGEIVPIAPPMGQGQAFGQETAQTANAAPPKPARVEPMETETGFIKIEAAGEPERAEKPEARSPTTPGPPPSISISIAPESPRPAGGNPGQGGTR